MRGEVRLPGGGVVGSVDRVGGEVLGVVVVVVLGGLVGREAAVPVLLLPLLIVTILKPEQS